MSTIQILWQRYVNMLCHGLQSSIKMWHGVVVLLVSDHISPIHSDNFGILRQIVSVSYPFTKVTVDTYNFVLRPSQLQILFFHLVIVVSCFEPSSVKSDRGCIFLALSAFQTGGALGFGTASWSGKCILFDDTQKVNNHHMRRSKRNTNVKGRCRFPMWIVVT